MAHGFDENRALLSGELDWKLYLKPKDVLDLDDCRRVDAFNEGIYEYNNAMLPRINELMKKVNGGQAKLEAPPKYAHMAQQKIRERMFTPEYRMLGAVKFLAKRNLFAERDYSLLDGPRLADDIAQREEIERRTASSAQLVDITDAVGRAHTKNCTCELKWDGKSERCVGMGARLRWRRKKFHHFDAPDIEPETY